MPLDSIDLRNLADVRLKDAKLLLDNGQYGGAYYLAGYAVECTLQAVIAARTRPREFPDLALARKFYTHDLKDLLDTSGMKPAWIKSLPKIRTFETTGISLRTGGNRAGMKRGD